MLSHQGALPVLPGTPADGRELTPEEKANIEKEKKRKEKAKAAQVGS